MSLPHKNVLEWSVFAVGLLLVASTLSYLVYAGLTSQDTAPRLHVELGAATALGDHMLVPVTVENSGDRAATNIEVVVEINTDGLAESARIHIDLIAHGQRHEGAVAFTHDPSAAPPRLRARIVGYLLP